MIDITRGKVWLSSESNKVCDGAIFESSARELIFIALGGGTTKMDP